MLFYIDIKDIISKTDHTILSPTASKTDIEKACYDAIHLGAASVCIPPNRVAEAVEYAAGRIPICTVAGFPLGYSEPGAKAYEARHAIDAGADEIDMVINTGLVKDGRFGDVLEEIKLVKEACRGRVLKVIIECCLLTTDEKLRMCEIVSLSGADFIKTSTGFSGGGATREDVILLARNCAPHVKIKAAGGIRMFEDAADFIRLGASRIGSSALLRLAAENKDGYFNSAGNEPSSY